eukprot:193515_1
MSEDREEVRLGDYVELTGHRMGMIKYVGDIHGKKGTYYGVELWKGDGKHSGTYEGIEYFECVNQGMGVFVVPKGILYILDVPKDYDPFQKLQEKKRAAQQKKKSQTSSKYTNNNKSLKLNIGASNQSRHRSNNKPSKTPKTKKTNQKKQTPANPLAKKQQSIRSKYTRQEEKDALKTDPSLTVRDGSESVMSVAEFKSISLRDYIGKGDNFDIAKRICKFYDELFNDTDTVCLVANVGLKPDHSFAVEGQYKRKETFTREGKYVFVYRAKPHLDTKVMVNKQCFKSVVKGLAMDYESAVDVVTSLNALFGVGCHVVRCKKVSFDIYSRFSDGYECELRLPSGGDYVLAWRR